MKKIISIICLAFLTGMLPGCKKWLEVSSKTDVVEKDMFSDQQGFMDAMAGAYYTMASDTLYGDKLTMGLIDVLARRYSFDWPFYYFDYSEGLGTAGYYQQPTIKGFINAIWSTGYNGIANVNNLLANIDARKSVFTGNNYNFIKGEAYAMRAFLHFDLLRMFGPSWLVGKDKLSIPYVTKFTGKTITPLSPVAAIIDSVISDLNKASTLLQEDNFKSSSAENSWLNNRKCHFNKWAVEAILARVYLYKGDKPNALVHAQNVIGAHVTDFVDPARLQNRPFDYSFSTEQILSLSKFTLDKLFPKYFTSGSSTNSQLTNDCGKGNGSTQSIERIYETPTGGGTDVRYLYVWTSYNDYYYCQKYNQSSVVEPNLVPLIRLPEMYYIAAECSPSSSDAITYLNAVRTHRGLTALPAQLDSAELQQQIFKEYQKEFYCEGQLWYYYKRLNIQNLLDHDNLTPIASSTPGYVFPLPDAEIQLGGR